MRHYNLLQEYYLIALDVFQNFHYANSSNLINSTEQELHSWISFLVTENLNDADQLIQKYPWLREIYQEIAALRTKPEEVLHMWSEVLITLDQNSLKYMVDELKDEVEHQKLALQQKDDEINSLKRQLAAQKNK